MPAAETELIDVIQFVPFTIIWLIFNTVSTGHTFEHTFRPDLVKP